MASFRYAVVPNPDGTFIVVDSESGRILSTHLRPRKASQCADRLNRNDPSAHSGFGRRLLGRTP
jgi:hypothetical protein